jgi:hAT family C-terminal dimerisation region
MFLMEQRLRLLKLIPKVWCSFTFLCCCAMRILGRECKVGADDCIREISAATDQQQPFTYADQSNEFEEEESGSSIARKRWSDNSFLKPFQLTAQLSGFPNLHMLYSIFCCLPVSSASAERALSKLKIVKNRLRTSMTDDTLGSLLLLSSWAGFNDEADKWWHNCSPREVTSVFEVAFTVLVLVLFKSH